MSLAKQACEGERPGSRGVLLPVRLISMSLLSDGLKSLSRRAVRTEGRLDMLGGKRLCLVCQPVAVIWVSVSLPISTEMYLCGTMEMKAAYALRNTEKIRTRLL